MSSTAKEQPVPAATRRSYQQFCGLARALDVVGERWTLLIVRDLYLGPQRYSDLLAGLPGLGTALLSDRLKHLETEGLVRRTQLPPPAATAVYELTDEGRELALAVAGLAWWGARRLEADERQGELFRPEWLLLALRARFDAAAARGVHDTYEFRVDGSTVHVLVDDGEMVAGRGPAPGRVDVVLETDHETLLGLSLGTLDAKQAAASGRATWAGTREAVRRMHGVFGPGRDDRVRREG